MYQWTKGLCEYTLVNGLTGDPCLCVFYTQTGDCVLFDLGVVDELPHKTLLKVRTVCISHTHIDHFVGFDRLLRVNIPHGREIEFCGPQGLAENIQGKLKGYTWNLVEQDQVRFRVHEIARDGSVSSFTITNNDKFRINACESPKPVSHVSSRPLPEKPATFVTNLSDTSRIEAVVLDHGIDSVAYLCQAPLRFSVLESELKRLNLQPGPWIKDLQIAIADARYKDTIKVGGKDYVAGELASEVMTYSSPRTLGYVTDISFSDENLRRLGLLMSDVETLVCEANFRDEHADEARKKSHLTTRQVAFISKTLRAEHTQIFHISKIYKEDVEGHLAEFNKFLKSE